MRHRTAISKFLVSLGHDSTGDRKKDVALVKDLNLISKYKGNKIMKNECELENQLNIIIEKAKAELTKAAESAISDVWGDYLPFAVNDTHANVSIRAEEIIKKLAGGDFIFDGNYALFDTTGGVIRVRIAMSEHMYCKIRQNLLSIMPVCPKDLEIASLKEQISNLVNQGY